ncbi:MAG: glycosyltransferase family 4 protein [Anaerolineae bacterium]|nr:glycosyltransferase family 4 protein [Thermoflexales bacterium]MDW8407410.1 glycosyltransferase family 4 protein [Anaerolineae bacterium]
MKIVWLAPFAYTPKATVSARMMPMATALARRGHRVTILIPPYDNPSDSNREWEQEGVHVRNMRLPHIRTESYRLLSLAVQLARCVHRLQPAVLHVFKPVGPGALAMWLLRNTAPRAPIVVDNDDWEGAGGWLDINPYPPLYKQVMAWQERWCLRHADAVTCASETLQARTRLLAGARVRTTVLPNGPARSLRNVVAQAEARRAELRAALGWREARVLIYAGTVPRNHDLDIAVRAIQANLPTCPTLRWVIVATGDGLPTLRATIEQAGLSPWVEYHGFVPYDRLIEMLIAADIALYPYRDTPINRAKCSGKVIDYMACAKPMVVSDVGMNRVYLQDGVSGLLTAPGDTDKFAQALARLLRDESWAVELGRAAQKRLWDMFDWDKRIEELETLYQVVLGG